MRIQTTLLIAAILTLSASGCGHIRSWIFPDEANNLSGVGAVITDNDSKAQFKSIELDRLLVQHEFAEISNNEFKLKFSGENGKQRRNELQDRLIAASNQKCALYVRQLTSSKSQTHIFWSGFAALLSGAATVVNPASAAKELAAGATVSNAYDSLYSQTYFQDMTLNVISSGISKRREALLKQITELQTRDLPSYTVNRAIADALTYHAACNIISGMEVAKDAMTKVSPETAATKINFK